MKACFIRLAACIVGILLGSLLFSLRISFGAGILMTALLFVMYVVLRPLAQVIILPLNLFSFGLLTVVSDALFVLWAAAWTPGYTIAYWQALIIAALTWLGYISLRRLDTAQGALRIG